MVTPTAQQTPTDTRRVDAVRLTVATLVIAVLTLLVLVVLAGRVPDRTDPARVADRFVTHLHPTVVCPVPHQRLGPAGPPDTTTGSWSVIYQGSEVNILVTARQSGGTWSVADWQMDDGNGWRDCGTP